MLMTVSLTASRAPDAMPSRMAWEPRLEVMMRMVFLKDTVRPWLSVTRPSSRICKPLDVSAYPEARPPRQIPSSV